MPTFSNYFVQPRVSSITSSATPTPNIDTTDLYILTAQAADATFGAPTGTPVNGQALLVRILDNGTARALAWNAIYRAGTDLALPTTTVLSKTTRYHPVNRINAKLEPVPMKMLSIYT